MSTTYAYKVRDRGGRVVSGSLDAENVALVANKLRQMGYVPISIDKKASVGITMDITIPGLSKRVKLKEIAVFSRQFATMINAGMTLLRALAVLGTQTENKHFATVIDQVRADIESGSSLSQALGRHPKQFDRLYIAMVRAGEVGGSLDHTLQQLSTTIEKQVALRAKIRSALAYPVVVLAIVVCILTAMLLFIVPIFKNLFADFGGKLPAPTQLLVLISDVFVHAFPLVVLAVIIAVIAFKRWIRTEKGRTAFDAFKLRVPIFGGLVRKTAMARFAGTLSTLLSSGAPVLEALDITADSVSNVMVARGVHAIAEGAKRGEPLTQPLRDHPVFPPMVTQMMAVGEQTGALDDMLLKVSEFYEQEVEATVNALTSLLEPLLIVVLGGTVGAMVIALYLPMFDIITLVGKSSH